VERSHSLESTETIITISRINLSRNRFLHLPADLLATPLPHLRFLDLSENQLGDRQGISLSVFGEVCVTSRLTFLETHLPQCDAQSFGVLPPQLRELNLSKNSLSVTDLSALLDAFHRRAPDRNYSLTRLLLPNNSLTSLPLSLLNHPHLRELQVSPLAFPSLPLFALTPHLSSPSSLGPQLSYNRLTSLEDLNFSVLHQLEILDLSNNKITALGNVFEATSLRVLLLENNALDSLPLELCYLTNLQTLSLHGNPQRTVRQAILQKGVNAILTVSHLPPHPSLPSPPSSLVSLHRVCRANLIQWKHLAAGQHPLRLSHLSHSQGHPHSPLRWQLSIIRIGWLQKGGEEIPGARSHQSLRLRS
jgi:Leucine-rich repeat (LRR) protein